MTSDPISVDQLLNDTQLRKLAALADAILPASEDGKMPSAAELNFISYLDEQARDFLELLPGIMDNFDDAFAEAPLASRTAALEDFAKGNAQTFEDLLLKVYDCYYQDDRVRIIIGAQPGPPFPRGNVIPAGDLSGLDAVQKRSRGYRR